MRRIVVVSALFFLNSLCAAALALAAPEGRSGGAAASNLKNWERGRLLYRERCLLCHGEDGSGWNLQSRVSAPPVPVPDLREPGFMGRMNDRELFNVIKEGGTREGKSRFMPPSGLWLSDEDIRDVIAYVRSLERRPASGQKGR